MKSINHMDISIRAIISTVELLIMFICIAITIRIKGIHITIHEFAKNLHLIIVCLRSHFIVNQKFDMERFILFITASRAE